MKRDEALLTKAIGEAAMLKKQLQNAKTTERVIIQPVAMPGVKTSKGAPSGE
jgi:hypothetical protein